MKAFAAVCAFAWAIGCGGGLPADPPSGTGIAPNRSDRGTGAPSGGAPSVPHRADDSLAASKVAPADARAEPTSTIAVRCVREIEGTVTAIALEKPPHAAAIGPTRLWIHDAKGWRDEPLPPSLRKEPPFETSVFFGRDDRVRIVASRAGADAESVYLRGRSGGGLAPEPSEIGRLGSSRGALVATLGTEDPEIVCRPGDLCIVKRRSGWTMFPAPAGIRRVTLGGGQGWGVADRTLLRLADGRWDPAGPAGAWETADALFATGASAEGEPRVWLLESAKARIHAFDGTAWRVVPSPIEGPRAIWGASSRALWLVGDGGLAWFDGSVWRRAADAPKPLSAVAGRGPTDVWIAGASGVFRVEREPVNPP